MASPCRYNSPQLHYCLFPQLLSQPIECSNMVWRGFFLWEGDCLNGPEWERDGLGYNLLILLFLWFGEGAFFGKEKVLPPGINYIAVVRGTAKKIQILAPCDTRGLRLRPEAHGTGLRLRPGLRSACHFGRHSLRLRPRASYATQPSDLCLCAPKTKNRLLCSCRTPATCNRTV